MPRLYRKMQCSHVECTIPLNTPLSFGQRSISHAELIHHLAAIFLLQRLCLDLLGEVLASHGEQHLERGGSRRHLGSAKEYRDPRSRRVEKVCLVLRRGGVDDWCLDERLVAGQDDFEVWDFFFEAEPERVEGAAVCCGKGVSSL